MIRHSKPAAHILSALAVAVLAGGCYGGGGDAGRSISGAAVKGPIQGATVRLFALDDAGNARGAAVATAVLTDSGGRFTLTAPAGSAPLLASACGGAFLDESDRTTDPAQRRRITLGSGDCLQSLLPAGATTLVITPYSNALLLKARRQAAGLNFLAHYDGVRQQAAAALGFDPASVLPEDPLAPRAGAPAAGIAYAMMLGGAAQAINAMASRLGTPPTFELVTAFIRDLSDGSVDGLEAGAPILVGGAALPDVNLNLEIERFRGNNFLVYPGAALASVDEALFALPAPLLNAAPVAAGDAFATDEETALAIAAPGVLGNDSDPEADLLSAVLVQGPAHGQLTLAPDGGFAYVPVTDHFGADSFTYRASGAGVLSNAVTVLLTVNPVDDAPLAGDDLFRTTPATGLVVAAPGLLVNDRDVDGDALAAELVASPPAEEGSVTVDPAGGFTFVPAPGFSGTTGFTYQARDALGGSNVALVTVNVLPIVALEDPAPVGETGAGGGGGNDPGPGETDGAAIRPNTGFAQSVLFGNDDGSTGAIAIGFPVNFFGVSFTQLYVNNNGNVTFDTSLGTYTPFPLTSTNRQILAPFFADVDTRCSPDVTYGADTVNGRPAFGVNWIDVGYYSCGSDKLNRFQLVMIDRSDLNPGDFDFEFNYGQVQWEAGGASGGSGGLGGSSARAGFSNGTGNPGTFFELPGSAVNGGFLDSNLETGLAHHSLGSGVTGRYFFQVRNGEVSTPSGAEIIVSLSHAVAHAVSVAYATADDDALAGVDYEAASGVLVFEPGETQKIIAVTLIDDEEFERDEDFRVLLSDPVGATLGQSRVSARILDDEPDPSEH